MAIILQGNEPEKIKKRMDTLFSKLNTTYSDKNISSLQKDHKKWDETAREISKQLGYASKNDFLRAYGYTIEKTKAGRPSEDYISVIDELKRRYPDGAPFESVDELKAANPDLAGKFKGLANRSNELFGSSLKQYFRRIGLIGLPDTEYKKQSEKNNLMT